MTDKIILIIVIIAFVIAAMIRIWCIVHYNIPIVMVI